MKPLPLEVAKSTAGFTDMEVQRLIHKQQKILQRIETNQIQPSTSASKTPAMEIRQPTTERLGPQVLTAIQKEQSVIFKRIRNDRNMDPKIHPSRTICASTKQVLPQCSKNVSFEEEESMDRLVQEQQSIWNQIQQQKQKTHNTVARLHRRSSSKRKLLHSKNEEQESTQIEGRRRQSSRHCYVPKVTPATRPIQNLQFQNDNNCPGAQSIRFRNQVSSTVEEDSKPAARPITRPTPATASIRDQRARLSFPMNIQERQQRQQAEKSAIYSMVEELRAGYANRWNDDGDHRQGSERLQKGY